MKTMSTRARYSCRLGITNLTEFKCVHHFTGPLCETEVTDCSMDPCANGSVCLAGPICVVSYMRVIFQHINNWMREFDTQKARYLLHVIIVHCSQCKPGYAGDYCEMVDSSSLLINFAPVALMLMFLWRLYTSKWQYIKPKSAILSVPPRIFSF